LTAGGTDGAVLHHCCETLTGVFIYSEDFVFEKFHLEFWLKRVATSGSLLVPQAGPKERIEGAV